MNIVSTLPPSLHRSTGCAAAAAVVHVAIDQDGHSLNRNLRQKRGSSRSSRSGEGSYPNKWRPTRSPGRAAPSSNSGVLLLCLSNYRSIRQTTEKSGAIWRGKLNCFIEMGPETLKEALRPSSAPLRHRHRRRSHRQRHHRERKCYNVGRGGGR